MGCAGALSMPNRIIREAILSSEKMASLGWAEEVFFRRLMSIVDDYGRTEANTQLLRARCYPLQTDQVRAADVTRWMAACQKSGLILCYAEGDKQYLEVSNFQQQLRSPSKCPAPLSSDSSGKDPPASDIKCYQPRANAHLGVSVSVSVAEGVKEKAEKASASPWLTLNELISDGLSKDLAAAWLAHRRMRKAALSRVAWEGFKAAVVKSGWTLPAAVEKAIVRGWTSFEAAWVSDKDSLTFKERDAANAAARVNEMTGNLVGAKPARPTRRNDALQEVFDAPKPLD